MNSRMLIGLAAILALGAGVIVMMSRPGSGDRQDRAAAFSESDPHATSHGRSTPATPRVPAYETAAQAQNLPATLPPAQFIGKSREAYKVAQEIPATLAQLPCYCECDKAFGHKSLHTCFVDDHASHCAVCVDEALLAYRLQKEEKLTPDEVREKIINKYSAAH